MKNLYFVNGHGLECSHLNEFFPTFEEAKEAWIKEGRPTQKGSSVWVSVYNPETFATVKTITISE